ncbi:MAG: hypothetical protein MZW92_05995 [Comamonadaceae bacterium]|nr:hypothetical protein [Comamonadaceae bacterium]
MEINTGRCEEDSGISQGQKVEIASRRAPSRLLQRFQTRTDTGWSSSRSIMHEASVNKLTNKAIDPVANIPEYKVCAVKLRKVA